MNRAINIVLWIFQLLLAAFFAWHGLLFLNPPPELQPVMQSTYPAWFLLFLGVAEIAAAIGLILPGITRILPQLTLWALVGILLILGSATVFHFVRNEVSSAITTLIMFVVAAAILYARWKVNPIAPRTPAQATLA